MKVAFGGILVHGVSLYRHYDCITVLLILEEVSTHCIGGNL